LGFETKLTANILNDYVVIKREEDGRIGVVCLMGLEQLNLLDLSHCCQLAKKQGTRGKVLTRIPRLAIADPEWFAVYIYSQLGESYSHGNTACVFPLMSIIKSFSLLYLLQHSGVDRVLQWVGVTPSDAAFNSLDQLVADGGSPRNPMINSGAITLADKLPGKDGRERTLLLCQWLNQSAGCHLHLDEFMLASVRSNPSSINRAIADYLCTNEHLSHGKLALDTYEQICCISGNVKDLALLGKLLACKQNSIDSQHRRIVNAVMLTCGLYEAAGDFAVQVGLPMKSGVAGGLLAIVPNQGAIACYSPPLDSFSNPIAGLALVRILAEELQLSIFG
jgi:glutaminase